MKKINPIHPGEILKEEFMDPYSLSIQSLSRQIYVSPMRISQIVNGKRSITPDTALRLSIFFQTTPEFWLNLQNRYDLEILKDSLETRNYGIKPYKQAV
ncbi:MAG: HigA family addiction module antidote protein [Leptospiraceae bacterium]|nr:HigA family addiction module antidote protein [Leptospiraceae bacterium]MCP5512428.1 HigA family addiction module antidote protein [Leptospiraceae bacterium]